MSTTLRILLAIGIATSLARGAPLGSPPRSRQLQPWLQQGALQWALDHTRGPDNSCHLFVATGPDAANADSNLVEDANLVAGNGIVFAVQSDEGDGDGVAITGLGFHVDQQTLAFFEEIGIDYEVYVLSVDGYYASPERDAASPGVINADAPGRFDYRGNINKMWTKIAEGQIRTDNLTQSPANGEFDFYQIPPGTFRERVPPNGGVRSFLIQTRMGTGQIQSPFLVSAHPPEGTSVNDAMSMKIANIDEAGRSYPRVLLGEGFRGYPMPTDPFAYERSLFMGVLYYEAECPASFTGLSVTSISAVPVGGSDSGKEDIVGLSTEGSDDSCYLSVANDPRSDPALLDANFVAGNGIVFAVQSDDTDDDGVVITGLAIHMDPLAVADPDDEISPGAVGYEVYALSVTGHYASSVRDTANPGMISADAAEPFDYRGDRAMWTSIAEGQITVANLTQAFRGARQFLIPPGTFRASIPPNGGIRSFYIHTAMRDQPSLVSARPSENMTVNDAVDAFSTGAGYIPRILVGEGFGYPFFMPDDPSFYHPSLFVGTLFYEDECDADGAPSAALSPSVALEATPRPELNLPFSLDDDAIYGTVLGSDGFCHLYAATSFNEISGSPIGGSGILLPIRSDEDDNDGVVITGIGFHIDPAFYESDFFEKVDYEVYVLSVDGYYASPERDASNSGMISTDAADPYDYRGEQNMAMWTKIAGGEISLEDLTHDSIVSSLPERSDATFYSIPKGAFRVHVPPNGGIRSFYIQTSPAGLIYADPHADKKVNDGMNMIAPDPGQGQHHPMMLVGEGFIVGQSMPGGRTGMADDPSFYTPKIFLGSVYYEWVSDEWDCVSTGSGAALSPTSSPWTNLIPTYVDYHDDYFFTMSGDDDDDDDYTVRYHAREPDGSCHLHQATHPDTPDPKSGDGILFSIESDAHDKDGLMITGLGFYVGPEFVTASSEIIDYELYTLSVDGYYASPERDATNPEMISADAEDPFDYRGEQNLDMWTKIAEGQITSANLTQGYAFDEPNLYLLQPGSFRVSVPSGKIRSFYLQLKPVEGYDSILVYSGPTGWGLGLGFAGEAVNDRLDMRIDAWPGPGHYSPYLRFGEAFVGKSMPDDPSAYTPGLFVGSIWYETLCPTSPHLPQPLEGGLLLSVSMKCNEGDGLEDLSEETRLAVVEAVESAAERAVAESNPYLISNIAAELIAAHCVVGGAAQRHLIGDTDQTVVQGEGDVMEFSVLITAEYVPPKPRPGEAAPPHEAPDLGALTETHINRDPELFARDLNDRAAEASPLAKVDASDVQVHSVVVVEDEPLPERFTKAPTPTPGIAQALSASSDGDDGSNVVGIVVGVSCLVVVALLLLGVYLFYAKEKPNPDKTAQGDVLATCEIESGSNSEDGSCPPVLSDVKRDEDRETRPVPVAGDEAKSERKSDEEEGIIVGAPSTVNVYDAEGTNLRDSAQSRFEGRLMQKLSSSAGGSSAEQRTNASGSSLGGSNPDAESDDLEAEEGDVDPRNSAQSRFEDRLMRKMSSSAERGSAVPDRPASLVGSVSAEQRGTSAGSRDAASLGGSASAEQRETPTGSLEGDALNTNPQNESFSRFERRLRRKLTGSAGGAAKVSPSSLDTDDSESSEKNSATPENIGAKDDGNEEPLMRRSVDSSVGCDGK